METLHEASLKKLFDYVFRVASAGTEQQRSVAELVGLAEGAWRGSGSSVDERECAVRGTASGPSPCFREWRPRKRSGPDVHGGAVSVLLLWVQEAWSASSAWPALLPWPCLGPSPISHLGAFAYPGCDIGRGRIQRSVRPHSCSLPASLMSSGSHGDTETPGHAGILPQVLKWGCCPC